MDELFAELMEYKKMVEPYVCDVSLYLWNALKEGKEVLLEGQLGSLKDPDHGIYPMVTSSSTLAAYGAIGAGVPPYEIKKVITVCKAYSSAVGAGAFVSEIFGEEADELRRRGGDGGEYGATTGRPRRMGWFDCVASKYGCRMQELQMLHLQCLMYLAIWMRFRYVQVMKSTAKLQQNSLQQDFLKKQNRFLKYFRDGKQISVESRNMKIFRRTAANI